jgi:hypothetical protein
MRVHVRDIRWDTEGKKVPGLPKKMVVEVDDDLLVDADFVEAISYALNVASDEVGWLISDSNLHAEEDTAPKGFDAQGFNEHCRPK